MKFGWPISLIFHSLILISVWISLSKKTDVEMSQAIYVELASIDELTNIRASIKKPDPIPIEPEQPMTVENPMENAPEEGDPETPERTSPETSPNLTPENMDQPDSTSKTEEKPFDLDSFSAVVDNTRKTQPKAGQQRTLASEQNFIFYSSVSQAAVGAGTSLSLNEIDALKSKMYECWREPVDAKNPEELAVQVRVKMRSDGHVQSVSLNEPRKVARSQNPHMEVAARRAVNAVKDCGPYDFLPIEKYSSWQDMVLSFIPTV
ncbi:MAG: hypothetical protein HKN36_03475 [Hellea sp.]|nr:hypothetical protein [Hellea sp.]